MKARTARRLGLNWRRPQVCTKRGFATREIAFEQKSNLPFGRQMAVYLCPFGCGLYHHGHPPSERNHGGRWTK